MTAEEFNSSQQVCQTTGKRPRLHYTGIHVIACCLDCPCSIHDAENHSTDNIIRAWKILHNEVQNAPPVNPTGSKEQQKTRSTGAREETSAGYHLPQSVADVRPGAQDSSQTSKAHPQRRHQLQSTTQDQSLLGI